MTSFARVATTALVLGTLTTLAGAEPKTKAPLKPCPAGTEDIGGGKCAPPCPAGQTRVDRGDGIPRCLAPLKPCPPGSEDVGAGKCAAPCPAGQTRIEGTARCGPATK